MLPADFPFRNVILGKPDNMTDEECMSLPVWTDGTQFISKWKLNKEELEEIAKTGELYIHIFSSAHPPILPSIECPIQTTGRYNVGDMIHCTWRHPFTHKECDIEGVLKEIEGNYYIHSPLYGLALMAHCFNLKVVPNA